MKYKIFGLLVLFFVLVPPFVLLADDPTSTFIDLGQPSTTLGGPSAGVAVNVEIWDAAVGGTMLGTEPHSVDTDSSGTITNDNGFGDFELGRGSGGVDPTFFQNAAASPISRYLDVTQAGASVLPGGTRIPFLTVPFALSVPLIHNFGTNNLFAGVNAGNFSMTGVNNTGVGFSALKSNTSGVANTASGVNALLSNTTGRNNTAIGVGALFSNIDGTNNTAMGLGADVSAGNLDNATAIGTGARVDASNKIRLGNSAITLVETSGNIKANGQFAVTSQRTDMVQRGKAPKNVAGCITINFPVVFSDVPDVVVSSHWDGVGGAIGAVEVIKEIARGGFTECSANNAPTYFVQWIAIGPR